ncbi:hypothetical protein LTR10_017677 [Elasticomyces elasticus]|uniref:AA1-like domain-containing protein n=1 Tax=Exophiala sideris TaxID=1016849 RepID=A0ABR0JBJ3_9EURO|nr:hypothetical protein LTR10_017677 [Elasticomyces elasticus]KAK5031074.1 hypothetical protein LTS07_004809 [Exophiala sideris]KAK5038796.1 hypothetical protein LTR13_003827 [Exophiala sideris]KAK5060679.1 hypothetical protein LTR69_005278 [Exophiala sideris]KAK5183592.1 hypothetical protein LTR44_003874 [Eurotiomycetes sp. CCFEE 6388]
MVSPVWLLLSLAIIFSSTVSAFSGNFKLTNMTVFSPSQSSANSTEGSYVEFNFGDEDTAQIGPIHCCVQWAVNASPPTTWPGSCDNDTFAVLVSSWNGVQDLTLDLQHTYIDNSVGEYPYNVLTKFANLSLAYPSTQYYDCDMSKAECQGSSAITAVVTSSTA